MTTTRNPVFQALLNELAKALPEEKRTAIVEGSNHPYTCCCDICLQWWVAMGPEPLDDGIWGFGPFTWEEFEAAGGTVPDYSPADEDNGCDLYDQVDNDIVGEL